MIIGITGESFSLTVPCKMATNVTLASTCTWRSHDNHVVQFSGLQLTCARWYVVDSLVSWCVLNPAPGEVAPCDIIILTTLALCKKRLKS